MYMSTVSPRFTEAIHANLAVVVSSNEETTKAITRRMENKPIHSSINVIQSTQDPYFGVV